ncbi:MAG TPA: ABC transporter permease [Dehalococcoidia bacterium]|jgi:peptide/nickel transport system permease protein|nr:ABC transporter permease [Dehalococcoidia bacterium]
MQTYILRRLLVGALILFVLSITVFILLQIVPGSDVVKLRCGLNCTPEGIAAERERLGLNDPYVVQYWRWLSGVLTGDLGTSLVNYRPVSDSIRARFPVTLELMVLTLIITVIVGIPAGVISAIWKNSATDYVVRVAAIFGLAVPGFWVATLVLILPAEWWGYAPPIGRYVHLSEDPIGNLKQFLPPAAVLAVGSAAGVMRLTRSSLLEVLRQDYMRTAKAKGLRERTMIIRHGLKNSLIPVVTVLGLQVSGLLGGAIIVEQIFALPGLGLFTFESLFRKDFPVVQTMTLYAGVSVVLLNLLVDVSYAWLDPRIRYS